MGRRLIIIRRMIFRWLGPKVGLYGPVNPQAGQWYSRPKSLHFSQRQMVTAPQEGQASFTAFSLGAILLPQDMQVDIALCQNTSPRPYYLKVDEGPQLP